MSNARFLEEEYNLDFLLMGLISYLKEYKLVYLINKVLYLILSQESKVLNYFNKSVKKSISFTFFQMERPRSTNQIHPC